MAAVENAFLYRHTPLEKRYLPLVDGYDPAERFRIADTLTKEEKKPRQKESDFLAPHKGFVEAYNERAVKEKKTELRAQSQFLYNEDGQRFGRVWDHQGFKNVHDPLSNTFLTKTFMRRKRTMKTSRGKSLMKSRMKMFI